MAAYLRDILRCSAQRSTTGGGPHDSQNGSSNERSGSTDFADYIPGAENCAGERVRISLGFLVPGGAKHGSYGQPTRDGDAAGSAAGFGAHIRRQIVCDA